MQKRPELELRLCTQYTGSDAQVLATKQAEATKRVPPGTGQAAVAAAPAGQPAVVPLPPTEQLINQFRKKLVALARQRADELKQQISLRHGVAAERLIVCQPAIDQKEEAKPRVELLF